MKILAVSMKFPTLLQTWFVNYLESTSGFASHLEVVSLLKGEEPYDARIDSLPLEATYHSNFGEKHQLFKALLYLIANLKKPKTRKFLRNIATCRMPLKDKIVTLQLSNLLEITQPDIIHCHSEKAAYRMLPILKAFEVPLYLTFHGLPPEGVRDLSRKERKILYNEVDTVVTNTNFSKRQCLELAPFVNDIQVIPQGINLNNFPYKPSAPPNNRKYVALTVGRLDRLKGHMSVIETIKRLLDSGVEIEYWIVGSGFYKRNIEKAIDEQGLQNHIKLLGLRSGEELINIYQSAHFFILPSVTEPGAWAETQGIVIQEAQALGLLAICTNSGGIPECINNNEDGFLYHQGSSDDLIKTLLYLIDNPTKWRHYQEQARTNVEKAFSLKKMESNLYNLYKG